MKNDEEMQFFYEFMEVYSAMKQMEKQPTFKALETLREDYLLMEEELLKQYEAWSAANEMQGM